MIYISYRSRRAEEHKKFRLACASFIEEYNNKVQIVQCKEETGQFDVVTEFKHPYPTTKILWNPDRNPAAEKDLLATTGDYLRIWNIDSNLPGGSKLEMCLNNDKNSEFCAPLTSFDWNETDPSIIGTSSIDTTCTFWDVCEN